MSELVDVLSQINTDLRVLGITLVLILFFLVFKDTGGGKSGK